MKRFGTFDGVFTPTILTIIGVILYLRLGWVIGHVGLLGGLLIIILAHISTITTGLSMSSITTNVRIGDGGFYSIISRSLGPEVGGAIGITLYLSQTFSIALYIIGFTEVWLSLFPKHEPHLISSIVLIFILFLSLVSAKIAIKFQYIIMLLIALSLFSFFMGEHKEVEKILLFNTNSEIPFWTVFAVFFPAVTGISAGASLSGELKNPKKNIPYGMLLAIGVGLIVYLAVGLWLGLYASTEELLTNTLIMRDLSLWKWTIIAGIMGATLSSALGSILGAPRILMALGQDSIIPFSDLWKIRSKNGEPRYSLLLTAIIVESSILMWDLNAIAPLLTMFFLITYAMINLAVFIEKGVGVTSFRPSFNIPNSIPLIGGLWCLIIMFLIDPIFAVISILILVIFYSIQVKRGIKAPWGDIREALFTSLGEWALKTSSKMPQTSRSWKPNLMIPVEEPEKWENLIEIVRDIVYPKGTIRLVSIRVSKDYLKKRVKSIWKRFFKDEETENNNLKNDNIEIKLKKLEQKMKKEGIFITSVVADAYDFLEGIGIVTQVMKGMFFPPNIMFLKMSNSSENNEKLEQLIALSIKEELGLIILGLNKEEMFKNKKTVNLWIRDKSPNQKLATLLSLELYKSWGKLRLIRVTDNKVKIGNELEDLKRIVEEQRLPVRSELKVLVGDFYNVLKNSPEADINIFGISGQMCSENMHKIVSTVNTSCLFTRGSGKEDLI